ncbi:hypothetical protein HOD29_04995 [archaeon]|jgi:hypothetical protein|nr:hypothetical protein [archaeon]
MKKKFYYILTTGYTTTRGSSSKFITFTAKGIVTIDFDSSAKTPEEELILTKLQISDSIVYFYFREIKS